ncbi:unknown [Clostridium sp. CAG:967]|nr:unknown [Clostridium sp. CAG:967]
MKVELIALNNYKFPLHNNNKKAENNFIPKDQLNAIPAVYYMPINFGCCTAQDNRNYFDKVRNVHCPCCGVEMITDKEALIKEAENVKTASEFVEFLNKYKENIPKKFGNYSDFASNLLEARPELGIKDLLNISRAGANKKVEHRMQDAVEYVKACKENNDLSQKDKLLCDEFINQTNAFLEEDKKYPLGKYKKILQETLAKLETNNKWEIYSNAKNPVVEANIYKSVFNYDFERVINGEAPAYLVLKNLFDFSQAVETRMLQNLSEEKEEEYNTLLVCSKCSNSESNGIKKLLRAPDEIEKINYQTYIADMSREVLENRYSGSDKYPLYVNGLMKRVTKGNVDASKFLNESRFKTKIFYLNRNVIEFDPVNIDGIPCACCGKSTITHKKKVEIFEKIAEANNINEMDNIINDNNGIIREKYMPVINKFHSVVKNNPDITEDEVVKILREHTAGDIKNVMKNNLKIMHRLLKQKNLSSNDKNKINEYIAGVKNDFIDVNPKKIIDYKSYNDLISSTLKNMELKNRTEYINLVKIPVKNLLVVQTNLFPIADTAEKYKSELKVILQDIIKMSVATKDHVVARDKDGTNDLNNLIVLCKDCNQDKTNFDFKYWIHRHPEMKENLNNYARFITDKIHENVLSENYFAYLEELSDYINRITDGEIEIQYDV